MIPSVVVALAIPIAAHGDGLPAPPAEMPLSGPVFSVEGIVSHERPIGDQESLSFWGGIGTVWVSGEQQMSWGAEASVELRHYLLDSGYSGANGGSYLGVALLQDGNGEAYVGVTPGMKLTLSVLSPSDSVLMEPYIGLSYPLTKEIDGGEWKFPDTPYVTLGFRVVFRHLARGDG